MAAQQTSVNISLPESMRDWIEERVVTDGYGTISEYVRALVREDQRRKAKDDLDRKLVEAIDSGEATEFTREDWADIRSTVRERLRNRPSRRAAK